MADDPREVGRAADPDAAGATRATRADDSDHSGPNTADHLAPDDPEAVDPLAEVPPISDPLWTLLREEVTDQVPDGVRGAARSSLGWRDPDSALAALIADSAAEEGQHAFVRGPRGVGQPRLLTFAAAQLTVEVEVTTAGSAGTATVNLVGQLVPAGSTTVTVDHSAGTIDVPADAMGRFQATGLGPGPLRVRCGSETGDAVRTDWFLP